MPVVTNPVQVMTAETIGILQPVYMPWLGYFEQIHMVDLFVILDDVQYTKRAWRNRNRIRTTNGWNWITVPVYQKGRTGQLIKDVEIDITKKWAARHWNCLQENYRHSKYWSHYAPFWNRVFKKEWRSLAALDLEIISFCVSLLGIHTKIVRASELELGKRYEARYGSRGDVTERNIFYISELGGKRFYEGPLGKGYLDTSRFERAGIELVFQDYRHPVYEQRYKPFIPYLSIVDLLFNHGPESLSILLCS